MCRVIPSTETIRMGVRVVSSAGWDAAQVMQAESLQLTLVATMQEPRSRPQPEPVGYGASEGAFEGIRADYDSGRSIGHISPDSSRNVFNSVISLRCTTCGGMGHQAAVCPSGAAF